MQNIIMCLLLLGVSVVSGMESADKVDELKKFVVLYSDDSLKEVRIQLNKITFSDPHSPVRIDSRITVKSVPANSRLGVCYNYAMMKTLARYGMQPKYSIIGCQDWGQMLNPFFKQVTKVKKHDLAVYVQSAENRVLKHFAYIKDPNQLIVRGKWGIVKGIYTHTLFLLPAAWGDVAIIYRLKKEYRQSEGHSKLLAAIKDRMESPLFYQLRLSTERVRLHTLAGNTSTKQNEVIKQEIIELLEQFPRIYIDTQNKIQCTPLMIAVQNGNCLIAELLLEYGASLTIKNMYGYTALDIAKKSGNADMIALLEKYVNQ